MTTKEKILLSAADDFAEKGFHAATIRDICESAGVNIAAVNYHFSSKEALYDKVFDFLFEKVDERVSCQVNLDITTESEWLDEIKKLLRRMLEKSMSTDPHERNLHTLFAQEMLHPSEHFPLIYKRLLSPRLDDIKRLFSYGDIESEEELNICVLSIISIVLSFAEKQALISLFTGNPDFGTNNLDLILENLFAGITASVSYKGKIKE
jgi:TetR/AcrR family transcriptional regulator, regulator of cefoperazone and chloramphenicol sensitivity